MRHNRKSLITCTSTARNVILNYIKQWPLEQINAIYYMCVCLPPIKLFPWQPWSCQPLSREHQWEEQLNLRGPCEEWVQKNVINKWETVRKGLKKITWDTCFHSTDMTSLPLQGRIILAGHNVTNMKKWMYKNVISCNIDFYILQPHTCFSCFTAMTSGYRVSGPDQIRIQTA